MKQYLDINQLSTDLQKYNPGSHQYEVLSFLSFNISQPLIETVDSTAEYLDELDIIPCGAIHHSASKGFLNKECTIKRKNIACCHTLDFGRGGKIFRPTSAMYNALGITLFSVGYILQQHSYDAPWFIEKENFKPLQKELQTIDFWPSIYNDGPCRDASENPFTVGEQTRIAEDIREKYVEPIREMFSMFRENNNV